MKFSDPAYYDLPRARGVDAQGVHCDYCHKVANVEPQAQLGTTHGRFGLKVIRPKEGQLFFGPLADVDRGEDAFSKLYRNSRYCASCHEGVVFGVHVYSTYSEWLHSPARGAGKHCQDCHMAPTGKWTNIAPGQGGIDRDPQTLASHLMFAGSREEMLQRCLHVTAELLPEGPDLRVGVEIRADDVGHRVPTGFIDRNLVLAVEAFADHAPVPVLDGPKLPESVGRELAGLAGRLFAKQLRDGQGRSPVPFWRALPELVDTRLVPGRSERITVRFPGGVNRVRVRVLHRRFWPEVGKVKGWPDSTIPVIDREWTVPPTGR